MTKTGISKKAAVAMVGIPAIASLAKDAEAMSLGIVVIGIIVIVHTVTQLIADGKDKKLLATESTEITEKS